MNYRIGAEENKWSLFQRDLIKMVENYPITYIKDYMMTPGDYKTAVILAWNQIGREMRRTQREVTEQWTSIKYRYAKLRNLIQVHNVKEELIKKHPKTRKYKDGCLDFIEDYVDELDDDEIPLSVHRRFNKMFGVKTVQLISKDSLRLFAEEENDEVDYGEDEIIVENDEDEDEDEDDSDTDDEDDDEDEDEDDDDDFEPAGKMGKYEPRRARDYEDDCEKDEDYATGSSGDES